MWKVRGAEQWALSEVLWRERRLLLTALACAVVGPVAAMGMPIAAKLVIDEVVGHGQGALLTPIALAVGVAISVQAFATYGAAQAGSIAGQRAAARLRRQLQRQVLRLPVTYFDRTPTGGLVSRMMADADQIQTLFAGGLLPFVSSALTALLAFAVLAWLDWRLALAIAAALALATVGLRRGFRGVRPAFQTAGELYTALAGRLGELLSGIRVVKSCGAERREAHALACADHRLLRASVEAYRRVAVLAAAIALASGGVSLGLLAFGGQAVVRGTLTLGDLALFAFLVGLLGAPLVQVTALSGELSRSLAALARIREVLALPVEWAQPDAVHGGRHPVMRMSVSGAITLEDVSYDYGQGRAVLRHVSLHAPTGSTVAILGANGAGKSTLLALLAAFDDPTAGRILIDGQPLVALDRASYRRHLGVVLQRDLLIDGTIAENIRYARPRATMAEFRRAARIAHCDEFVEELPAGYDTFVGERGLRLSGGQRQRVAIARALLADPRIVLLDEPGAHLDPLSEQLIRQALGALCEGRTAFMVSHRAGVLPRIDQVIVLQGGAVVEQGAPAELRAQRGRYWRLVAASERAEEAQASAN